MHLARRFAVATFSLAVLTGCLSTDNGTVQIPPNAIIYKLDPSLLRYTYTDTTAGNNYFLTWLPTEAFVGINCLGIVPRSSVDTTGTFVFASNGPNTGRLEHRENATTDTVTAYFLPVSDYAQGTHGTYAVDQTGRMKLFWADGTQSRYFDPSATIRLFGDTIRSVSDIKTRGDSLRVVWDVWWTVDDHC